MSSSNSIVAAVGTAEMQQRALDDSHREVVRVIAELQNAKVDQKLADAQSRLEDSQRRNARFSLENVVNRQQDDLVVDAAVLCDVERRAGHLGLVQASVDDVRVRLGAKHLALEHAVGAAVDANCIELGID